MNRKFVEQHSYAHSTKSFRLALECLNINSPLANLTLCIKRSFTAYFWREGKGFSIDIHYGPSTAHSQLKQQTPEPATQFIMISISVKAGYTKSS